MTDPNAPGGETPQQPTTPVPPVPPAAPNAQDAQPTTPLQPPVPPQAPAQTGPAYQASQPPQVPQAPQPPQVPSYGATPPVPPQQGYPMAGAPQPVQPKGLAIAALIVGIVSLVFCWFPVIGILGGIAAVILGIIALKKAQSKGMSITGLITGGLAIIASVAILVISLVFISWAAQSTSSALEELDQATEELENGLPDTSEDFGADETDDFGADETDDGTATGSGERSAEFCAALDTVSTADVSSGATEIAPELVDAYRTLSELDSPNQALYAQFAEYIEDPLNAEMPGTEFYEALMEDTMACL